MSGDRRRVGAELVRRIDTRGRVAVRPDGMVEVATDTGDGDELVMILTPDNARRVGVDLIEAAYLARLRPHRATDPPRGDA